MPLPDERPRASVANLIGRFEQRQNKRQSMTGSPTPSPSVSRSTSVVSHHTGDSSVIEAKERREWPPKQVQSNTTTATSPGASDTSNAINLADLRRSLSPPVASPSERNSLVSPPLDAPSDPSPQSLSVSVESIVQDISPEPVSTSDPVAESASEPEAVEVDVPKKAQPTSARAPGKIVPSKSTPASTNAPSRVAAARGTTPRPSAAAAHSKSTPSTPAKGVPAAKPLKAQNTGTSTARTTARLGAKSPPARSKTPSGLRASTSASKVGTARSKTPTPSSSGIAHPKAPSAPAAGVARPKTPSGLYAPTKASLARARNAEAPPAPVKKATVTTSALERLTKPTAASASKARGPVVSPPRPTAAKTARGAAPTRGATIRPRVGLAPARMKAEREKKEKEAVAKKTAPMSGDETTEHSAASEHTPSNASEDEFGHRTSSDAHLSHPYSENEPPSDIESYDDAFASDGEDHMLDSAHIQSALPREEGELAPFAMTPEPSGKFELEVESEDKEVEHIEAELPAVEAKEVEEVPASESEKEEEAEPVAEEAIELEVKPETVANGTATPTAAAYNGGSDDFDSVLGMLSVKPAARTPSPSSDVVAVAGEIPDEE